MCAATATASPHVAQTRVHGGQFPYRATCDEPVARRKDESDTCRRKHIHARDHTFQHFSERH